MGVSPVAVLEFGDGHDGVGTNGQRNRLELIDLFEPRGPTGSLVRLQGLRQTVPMALVRLEILGVSHFDSFGLDAGAGADRAGLQSFFAALPETVYRAKGFMRIDGAPSLVQFSNGQLDITATEERQNASMVFIGRGLDQAAIERGLAAAAGTSS